MAKFKPAKKFIKQMDRDMRKMWASVQFRPSGKSFATGKRGK